MTLKKNEVTISWGKVVGSVIVSMVIGAFGGIITILRIANSDHFTIIAHDKRIGSIEAVVVPRTELESTFSTLLGNDNRMEQKIDDVYKLLINRTR